MATLLHIDSSFGGDASASRAVTAAFRAEWEAQHPNGTVVYRDLAAEPLPHLDAVSASSVFVPADQRTPEQAAAAALRDQVATEVEQADVVLIGAPMYNFSIPSTLKAWIDHLVIVGRTNSPAQSAAGTPTVVVASRGGSYREGTPRESFEFVQNYLGKQLGDDLGLAVEFIVPELTLARSTPAMAELVDKADASREEAHATAVSRAKDLAAAVTA